MITNTNRKAASITNFNELSIPFSFRSHITTSLVQTPEVSMPLKTVLLITPVPKHLQQDLQLDPITPSLEGLLIPCSTLLLAAALKERKKKTLC